MPLYRVYALIDDDLGAATYFGYTRRPMADRLYEHHRDPRFQGRPLRAIVLFTADSEEAAAKAEASLIAIAKTLRHDLENRNDGGGGPLPGRRAPQDPPPKPKPKKHKRLRPIMIELPDGTYRHGVERIP